LDGAYPEAGLVQAADGDLYGTTFDGGAQLAGTVFRITPNGRLTTLYSFCSETACAGLGPEAAPVQATNGDLYGTTVLGLGSGGGTVFKTTPSGTTMLLYSFCSQSGCTDGSEPFAGLVQATNRDLYGTTLIGGANASGTIFKITPSGTLTTLYSFCAQSGCPDGERPFGGLIRDAGGNLYGTTELGGADASGTVFKIGSSGITLLHTFCSEGQCEDGAIPESGLVQGTNGIFYGTTFQGGTNNLGTIFALSTGEPPFVETRPTIGAVGEKVTILGYELTGATSVTFDGIPAAFTVDASTAISTTVPSGATTGKVQVITPDRTLSSNVSFEVAP
jgi:uncharacterized repeat protein (TIGR03803 family)